ncbi:MAG: hypothetical protein DMF56_18260 [Acidobacteria bacterium]|nr:MAG: hypothetical protein DMF56_18260 [Acidobacteriota bacterium]
MASLRHRIGALIYDGLPFERTLRAGDWLLLRNRAETITSDGRGVQCLWALSSDIHIANVFPSTSTRILKAALRDWPIALEDAPPSISGEEPAVSFVIGHRGLTRLPHLLQTLRSIAAQRDAAIECIVVEQSSTREIEPALPNWVRYLHTPIPSPDFDYSRSWTFNAGAGIAHGRILVLHDNDMLVPQHYAREILARANEGWSFIDLKRFVFYLDARYTQRLFDTGLLSTDVHTRVVQNLQGGSVIAARDAYFDIGGFDESFIGWGGEDNDFRERADAHGGVYPFGYLPMVHLYHEPQAGKIQGNAAPAVQRYHELAKIPAEERIRRLRELRDKR